MHLPNREKQFRFIFAGDWWLMLLVALLIPLFGGPVELVAQIWGITTIVWMAFEWLTSKPIDRTKLDALFDDLAETDHPRPILYGARLLGPVRFPRQQIDE